MDTTFHMTYARSAKDLIVPYFEYRNIPVMTNATHRYSESSGFRQLWDYDTAHIVDSSGYSVLNEYGGYPWSVEEYHNWLKRQRFNWAAVMDYACEETFDDIMTVEERMEKTLENTIKHYNLDPDYNIVPVLQGRSIEQYIEFYDMLQDHGIPTDRVGLGTICRISSSEEIIETEQAIRERTDVDWIHGFGVKIEAYKMGANFESADSQAWAWPAQNGNMYLEGKNSLITRSEDNAQLRTYMCFKNYYDYVTRIIRGEDASYNCDECEFETSSKKKIAMHSTEKGHDINV